MKRRTIIFTFLCMLLHCGLHAQIERSDNIQWYRVERDSLPIRIDSLLTEDYVSQTQPTDDQYRVVTNRFWDNWWVYGDLGIHTFRGDWSGNGKFKETLSPDFTIGVGKWFTPGLGIKAQFGIGNSRGFTEIWTPYAVGSEDTPMYTADGISYWKLKTKWWDFNANVVFNLSRLFFWLGGV